MSDEVKTCKRGSRIRELLLELQTYKDEYRLAAAKAMLDVEAVRAAMNLATDKENRFDSAD